MGSAVLEKRPQSGIPRSHGKKSRPLIEVMECSRKVKTKNMLHIYILPLFDWYISGKEMSAEPFWRRIDHQVVPVERYSWEKIYVFHDLHGVLKGQNEEHVVHRSTIYIFPLFDWYQVEISAEPFWKMK